MLLLTASRLLSTTSIILPFFSSWQPASTIGPTSRTRLPATRNPTVVSLLLQSGASLLARTNANATVSRMADTGVALRMVGRMTLDLLHLVAPNALGLMVCQFVPTFFPFSHIL